MSACASDGDEEANDVAAADLSDDMMLLQLYCTLFCKLPETAILYTFIGSKPY